MNTYTATVTRTGPAYHDRHRVQVIDQDGRIIRDMVIHGEAQAREVAQGATEYFTRTQSPE